MNYVPTLDEVGAILRMRTFDANGVELGTFTDKTRPTAAQAQALIDSAAAKMQITFGDTVPDPLLAAAREIVTFRAAMMIELSFFGAQIRVDRSPYNELNGLYAQALKDFVQQRTIYTDDQGIADPLGPAGEAVSVPADSGFGSVIW